MVSLLISIPAYDGKLPFDLSGAVMGGIDALRRQGIGSGLGGIAGCSLPQKARDSLVRQFLFESRFTHLLMIDNDTTFQPAVFERVAEWMRLGYDFVAGAVRLKDEAITFRLSIKDPMERSPCGQLLRIDDIGAAFVLLSRAMLQDLWDKHPEQAYDVDGVEHRHLFQTYVADRQLVGEDMAFCALAGAAGYALWVDPSLSFGHVGQKAYEARLLDYLAVVAAEPEISPEQARNLNATFQAVDYGERQRSADDLPDHPRRVDLALQHDAGAGHWRQHDDGDGPVHAG